MSIASRKAEILRLQNEGAEAAMNGLSRQVGIQKYKWNADCIQWLKGYDSVPPPINEDEFEDESNENYPI